MGGKALRAGTLLIVAVLTGCARERKDLPAMRPSEPPPASERTAVVPDSEALERSKADLQSRVLGVKSRIATLSTDLQSAQANAASERGIVESQLQKEMSLRQQEMQEIAASIRVNDEYLRSRERELRINLGPTGTSYEGDENLSSLRREITSLQARGLELRSAYASLADESRGALSSSATTQQQLLSQGRERQSDLAASIIGAQAELAGLEGELAKAGG